MDNGELANDLRCMINKSKLTVICGDFNLCYIDDSNNVVTKMLESEGFYCRYFLTIFNFYTNISFVNTKQRHYIGGGVARRHLCSA